MKISLVIPVYNVAPYLTSCLKSVSVAVQNMLEASDGSPALAVELICVDDGSSDGSFALLESGLAASAPDRPFDARILRQAHSGVSAARNAGLSVATGDYVWCVDGDDVVSPDAFRTLSSVLRQTGEPDIVQFRLMPFADRPDFPKGDAKPRVYDLSRRADRQAAYDAHALWLLGSSALYRRARFGDVRFANFSNGEDSLWGRRAFYRAHALVFVDCALYGYRQRADGAHQAWTLRRWWEFCRVSWLMTLEGVRVRGLRFRALLDGLRALKHAWTYLRRVRRTGGRKP